MLQSSPSPYHGPPNIPEIIFELPGTPPLNFYCDSEAGGSSDEGLDGEDWEDIDDEMDDSEGRGSLGRDEQGSQSTDEADLEDEAVFGTPDHDDDDDEVELEDI